ncbi:MAG: glycosyltransferase [Desulfovibrio sp.]|nr:glycosyltransferase [Desulfovibrio sp.]
MKKYLDIFTSEFGDIFIPPAQNSSKISILCAHYNNHAFLPDFIRSLQWQTYDNWEAIIVDDCSTMGDPVELVAAAHDPRIIYHRLDKNAGACAARNAAFARSSGEYVICLDPDDIVHPAMLTALGTHIEENENQIVMFDYICFGNNTALYKNKVYDAKKILSQQWIAGTSLVNHRIWERVGGQDSHPALRYGNQDWEFWLNVLEHYPNIKIIHIPLPLMLYRQHEGAISPRRLLHDHETRKYILRKHQALFDCYDAGTAFLAGGYAISTASRLFSRDFSGAVDVFVEGMRACPARLLCRCLPGELKSAFLQTRTGRLMHPWLRKLKHKLMT